MKKILWLCGLLMIPYGLYAQAPADTAVYALIPAPVSLTPESGFFSLDAGLRIVAPAALQPTADLLKATLGAPKTSGTSGREIRFVLDPQAQDLGREGYRLTVTPNAVRITAPTREGAIHGLFTLLQLRELQPDITHIPCVRIEDTPRFRYRGMHLDVSRHFFPVSFIKKFIDMMALYRFNTFHWHLTDGAGWRLEIKKYPLLTQQAAWRTDADLKQWGRDGRRYLHQGDPRAYGGYYTQDEARDVVAYAAARGITVIPEIEMPAHAEEVLAVYPQLSCSGVPYKNSEFCIGNDSTFTFLEDVLSEVMQIFPSPYIHIGGDEASMRSWRTCPKCQRRMREEGLHNVEELQSYAVKRIEKFLVAHGRQLLGWDEIFKGGLAPEATVMSWRGEAGGIQAARSGHDVVMTPGAYCYFDHYQSDPNTQPPAIGGYIPLDKVYGYDPVPADSLTVAQQSHILGVQANLWTEYMPTTYRVEYRTFPRMLALAEVAWSPRSARHFDDFKKRLQAHYLLLQRHQVNYYRPSYRVHVRTRPDTARQESEVWLSTEIYQPEIHYTLDGSAPSLESPRYTGPFYVPGSTRVNAQAFHDGKPADSIAAYTADYHRAIGKKVLYNHSGWSPAYPAQRSATLTNGIKGSLTYQDDQWQGFLGDVDVTVDLGHSVDLQRLAVRFMQLTGPGVYMPGSVSVSLSEDGEHFTPAGKVPSDISPDDSRLLFETFRLSLQGKRARYVRVQAPNTRKAYLFTDEIVIY